jgi:hypothetical protein
MGIATDNWPEIETDPQRQALLTAADRLLAGTPTRSTGNLSVVQLAIEADVRYWVAAQKHPDLRNHFQRLAAAAKQTPNLPRSPVDPQDTLIRERTELRAHCANLEQLVTLYATVINELVSENEALQQITGRKQTVTPLDTHRHQPTHQIQT